MNDWAGLPVYFWVIIGLIVGFGIVWQVLRLCCMGRKPRRNGHARTQRHPKISSEGSGERPTLIVDSGESIAVPTVHADQSAAALSSYVTSNGSVAYSFSLAASRIFGSSEASSSSQHSTVYRSPHGPDTPYGPSEPSYGAPLPPYTPQPPPYTIQLLHCGGPQFGPQLPQYE